MAYLIVNADDLGADRNVDKGILEAFRNGIVTSATMLVTFSSHWEESAREAQTAGLPTGLHLSLTHGFAISPREKIPDLVDDRGRFKLSARRLISMAFRPKPGDEEIYEQIKVELAAQLDAVLSRGLSLSHVDSHQHVHMNPRIFALVESAAENRGITKMRFVREPFFRFQLTHGVLENIRRKNVIKALLVKRLANRIKPRLKTNDRFFGLMQSDTIDQWSFEQFLRSISRTELVWEAGIHPGHAGETQPSNLAIEAQRWFRSSTRERELDVIMNPRVRRLIQEERIQLVSYASIA